MSEFLTEDRFLKLIAAKLREDKNVTSVDERGDWVEGSFTSIVYAVCDVADRHGHVVWGD